MSNVITICTVESTYSGLISLFLQTRGKLKSSGTVFDFAVNSPTELIIAVDQILRSAKENKK